GASASPHAGAASTSPAPVTAAVRTNSRRVSSIALRLLRGNERRDAKTQRECGEEEPGPNGLTCRVSRDCRTIHLSFLFPLLLLFLCVFASLRSNSYS